MSSPAFSLPPLPRLHLSLRQWLTFAAHGFKATVKQHHGALFPLFRSVIDPDAVILDVGAHAGQFAKLFARLAPQGIVYSFEPGRYARGILMLAIALNRIANVRIFPLALGAAPATLELRMPVKRSGSFGFGLSHLGGDGATTRRETVETIDVVTIDGFCDLMRLRRLDFIKADIEGWELQMLKGGAQALRRFRPALWLEVVDQSLARAGESAAALFAFMAELDYLAYVQDAQGALRPVSGTAEGDLLWLPREAGLERMGVRGSTPAPRRGTGRPAV